MFRMQIRPWNKVCVSEHGVYHLLCCVLHIGTHKILRRRLREQKLRSAKLG